MLLLHLRGFCKIAALTFNVKYMSIKQCISPLLVILIFSSATLAQTGRPVTDFLHVSGPVAFNSKTYNLSWTSHPNATFYKQEYLVKGDDANKFHSMLLLDAVTGEMTVKDVVAKKVSELKTMKERNPAINYEVINNAATGEYLLDFLVTANAPDGSMAIAERNVYRYKHFTDKTGHQGILLFGVSTRVYGNDINSYLTSLKSRRSELVTKVAQMKIPEILIDK